jgi:drug/metabolite transporter (DMT)-like permease
MLRVLVATVIATISGALGQILMRRGMQIVGPLEDYAPLEMLAYFGRALLNPYVIGGTILSGILYFALLAALSWTDLTVAFPLTAIEYIIAALLAVFILKEAVPPLRWVGIGLVVVGVLLISATGTESPGAPGSDDQRLSGGETSGRTN